MVRFEWGNENLGDLLGSPNRPAIKLKVRVEARDPCPQHGTIDPNSSVCPICGNERPLVGSYEAEDLATNQFANLVAANILPLGTTVHDITNAAHNFNPNTAILGVSLVAGTVGTTATVADYGLGAISVGPWGAIAITQPNSSSPATGAGASGTTTFTQTITNSSGGTIQYNECGMYVITAAFTICIAHDAPFSGGPFGVSGNGGTLQVTYTLTNS